VRVRIEAPRPVWNTFASLLASVTSVMNIGRDGLAITYRQVPSPRSALASSCPVDRHQARMSLSIASLASVSSSSVSPSATLASRRAAA
jgi:hypothetical protein